MLCVRKRDARKPLVFKSIGVVLPSSTHPSFKRTRSALLSSVCMYVYAEAIQNMSVYMCVRVCASACIRCLCLEIVYACICMSVLVLSECILPPNNNARNLSLFLFLFLPPPDLRVTLCFTAKCASVRVHCIVSIVMLILLAFFCYSNVFNVKETKFDKAAFK